MSLYRRSRDAGDEDADGTLAVMYMEGEAGAWMVPWGHALIYYEAYRQALADAFPWGEVFREMVLNVFRVVQAVLSPFSFE